LILLMHGATMKSIKFNITGLIAESYRKIRKIVGGVTFQAKFDV